MEVHRDSKHENDSICRCFCDLEHIPIALPSVSSRLRNATPSKEFLEHYRKKVDLLEKDFEEISSQIDVCKTWFQDEFNLRKTIAERNEEVSQLRKAVSDMQVHLFREQDQVLRLNAENDRLNLKHLEDKKIIELLLGLAAIPEREVTVFRARNTAKLFKASPENGGKFTDSELSLLKIKNEMLTSQVNSLQNQLHEQSQRLKAEVAALVDDRRIWTEEFESDRSNNAETIAKLTEQLREVQMRFAANLSEKIHARKRSHVEFEDVQQPIRNDRCKLSNNTIKGGNNRKSQGNLNNICRNSCPNLSVVKDLKDQLKNCQEMLQSRRIDEAEMENTSPKTEKMENKPQFLSRNSRVLTRFRSRRFSQTSGRKLQARDEVVNIDFGNKNTKALQEQLDLFKKRYRDLERRRRLEIEGFQNDIKFLKENLSKVEEMLYKVTLTLENDDEAAILKIVKQTAGKSKKIVSDLNVLKRKISSLENDMKFL